MEISLGRFYRLQACPVLLPAAEGERKMTLTSLQALTWGTVTGAVLSALLLASGESGLPELPRLKRADPPRAAPEQQAAQSRQRPAPAPVTAAKGATTAAAR